MVDTIRINADYNKFLKLVERAIKAGLDLRPVLESIAVRWFRSNRAIFTLQSNGGYADLLESYKIAKDKAKGFIYPILRYSGRLERSLTDMSSGEAIKEIVNKKSVRVGSSTPYVSFLQEGTRFMKARPPVLIGAEKQATVEQHKNIAEWRRILTGYIGEALGEKW